MTLAAARSPGPASGPIALLKQRERIFRRGASRQIAVYSRLKMPVREQQTEWSQRVEPEKERGTFQDARFTACQLHQMSSDYRPRGGSEGAGRSGGAGGGGRRRRGGRGRSGGQRTGSHGESRVHANGGSHSTPKKEKSLFEKLFGWLKPKASKPETKQPYRSSVTPAPSRAEFKERTPGAERVERSERAERPRREDRPPKADPTPQEITSPKLYVGNLAYEAAESDLHDLFSKVGLVKNVEIAMDRHSNRSKGFGFVEMEALETAKEAAAKLNRTDFMGRQIVVSGAKVDRRPVPSNPRETDPTAHEAQVTAPEPEPQHEQKPEAGSSNPDATA